MKKINKQLLAVIVLIMSTMISLNSCKKSNTTLDPVVALPTVTNVQPKNPLPGDVVTITGTGFGAISTDVKVTIGSQVITITSVTDTQIKFTLPAGITAGDIAVAIKNIIANNTDPQKATITPQPAPVSIATIIALNPTTGKVGDVVTITGTNFSTTIADNVVKFNGVTATVTAATATSLTLTVPATATTGVVTLSVKSASAITGPSFTVNSTTGGTSTAVPYINVLGGSATFSKIATAPEEIGAMIVDKVNNVLYYADYTAFAPTHAGTLYKLKLDGSAPAQVSTDSRINTIVNMATDVAGNIYVEAALDQLGIKANVYKIDPATGSVAVIATNASFGGNGGGLFVDSKGSIWLNYTQRLNVTTGLLERPYTASYGSFNNTLFQGDNIYVDDTNHLLNMNYGYYKFNLLTGVATATDFTLQGLFSQDNPAMLGGNGGSNDLATKYAVDNNENFYAVYEWYVPGQLTRSFSIRKTKNGGSGSSTLITKFNSVFKPLVYFEPYESASVGFAADAVGNLYLKDNKNDIIKITY